MRIAAVTIQLYAPWVHSLKEKRAEVKSLLARIHNKFNVSAAEVAEQDTHQTIVLGIAAVAANAGQADSILDHVLAFIEANTQAEATGITREII